MKTGIPPSYTTGLTVASKVISEQNTFLLNKVPLPISGCPYIDSPASLTARWSDAVPADKATAY